MSIHRVIVKTKINPETVKDLNDEQLAELVYSKASQLDCQTFGETFKSTDEDILLREIYSTFVVDIEIYNGGFDQCFCNSSSEWVPFSIVGLRKIGADKHADLIAKAAAIFDDQKEKLNEGRIPDLDACDDEYYKLEEFYPLREEFIRKNIEHFYD